MKKFLWYFLFTLIGLVGVYSTLCYFASTKLDFVQTKTIKAPSLMIFNQLNDFNNWSNWSSWSSLDTSFHMSLGDIKEGKGAEYLWSGRKIEGKITISDSKKPSLVNTIIGSNKNDTKTYGDWDIKALTKEKTKVEVHYYSDRDLPFFLRGYRLVSGSGFRMKKGVERDLNNLETIIERQFKDNIYNGYKVNEKEQKEAFYVVKRGKVQKDEIQQFYAQNLGFLFQSIQKHEIKMNGMPSGLYFQRDLDHNNIEMAAAIPVAENLAFDDLSTYTIPNSQALEVDFYGDYKDIGKAHNAIKNYMKDHNVFYNPPMIETYITDPSIEKDVNKWLTKVRYFYNH